MKKKCHRSISRIVDIPLLRLWKDEHESDCGERRKNRETNSHTSGVEKKRGEERERIGQVVS